VELAAAETLKNSAKTVPMNPGLENINGIA